MIATTGAAATGSQILEHQPDPTPAARNPHLAELDGLRGVAILMVFLLHNFAVGAGGSFAYRAAAEVVKSLWCGVDLFFVLSGFLITGILLDTRGSGRYFTNFFVRRSLRIFPLYFSVAAAVFLVLPAVAGPGSPADRTLAANQGWVWTYTVNVKAAVDGGLGVFFGDRVYLAHLWSLSIEEHFYLVWPFIVAACTPRALRRVCLGCVILAVASRVGLWIVSAPPITSYVFTLCRIDSLAVGGLLALTARTAGDGVAPPRYWRSVGLGAAVGLIGIFAWRGGLDFRDWPVRVFGYTLLAFGFAGLIGAALTLPVRHPLRRICRWGALRTVGKYSYGLYVYHLLLQPAFRAILTPETLQTRFGLPHTIAGVVWLGIAFMACLAVAVVSWVTIERYPLRLKRYF